MIIQIYEIQTPAEAAAVIRLGVNHIGSVIVSREEWKTPTVRETIAETRRLGAVSTLIPLFSGKDEICQAIDYFQPDILHLCENITEKTKYPLMNLQEKIKTRYPDIKVMRSIPIERDGNADMDSVIELARRFEPFSDYFLTDTRLSVREDDGDKRQPVEGFVGITGQTCSWRVAAELVNQSGIPVILAGGISPENAFEGIKAVKPAGIDSCTRTNAVDQNGNPVRFKKDLQRVELLVQEARKGEKALLSGKIKDN